MYNIKIVSQPFRKPAQGSVKTCVFVTRINCPFIAQGMKIHLKLVQQDLSEAFLVCTVLDLIWSEDHPAIISAVCEINLNKELGNPGVTVSKILDEETRWKLEVID